MVFYKITIIAENNSTYRVGDKRWKKYNKSCLWCQQQRAGWRLKKEEKSESKIYVEPFSLHSCAQCCYCFFSTISTKSGRLKKKCLMTWQTAPKKLFKYSCGFIQTFRNHALFPWERSKIIILHSPPIYSNSFRLNNLNKRAGHEKFCLDGSVNKKGGCACW